LTSASGSVQSLTEKAPSRSLDESMSSFDKISNTPSPEQGLRNRSESESYGNEKVGMDIQDYTGRC